jgi:hypothetical protein
MATVTQKQQYLAQMQSLMTQVAQIRERAAALSVIFADRAYDAAAADPITLQDLDSFGVIVFDLGAAVNLCQAFGTFMADATRSATVNKWRQV